MTEDAWPKVGASFGIVFAVLAVLTFIVGPSDDPPGFEDSATQVQTYLQDNRSDLQAVMAITFAAIVAFVWFLGSVFYRLRPAEPAARLSAAALAGGVLVAAAGLVGTAAAGASLYHVETLSADTVLALWDLSLFAYLFFLVGLTVLAGASGMLALRSGALPAGLGGFSVLLAAVALIVGIVGTFSETGAFSPSDGALGFITFLLFILWVLAMGVTLVREPRPALGVPRAAGEPRSPGSAGGSSDAG
jgi:hypothetical protein